MRRMGRSELVELLRGSRSAIRSSFPTTETPARGCGFGRGLALALALLTGLSCAACGSRQFLWGVDGAYRMIESRSRNVNGGGATVFVGSRPLTPVYLRFGAGVEGYEGDILILRPSMGVSADVADFVAAALDARAEPPDFLLRVGIALDIAISFSLGARDWLSYWILKPAAGLRLEAGWRIDPSLNVFLRWGLNFLTFSPAGESRVGHALSIGFEHLP